MSKHRKLKRQVKRLTERMDSLSEQTEDLRDDFRWDEDRVYPLQRNLDALAERVTLNWDTTTQWITQDRERLDFLEARLADLDQGFTEAIDNLQTVANIQSALLKECRRDFDLQRKLIGDLTRQVNALESRLPDEDESQEGQDA